MNLFNYQTIIEENMKQDLLIYLFETDEINQEASDLDQEQEAIDNSPQNFENLFTLKFLAESSEEIKQKLKERKVFFNSFRKEYYSRGDKSEIEELLKGYPFKLQKFSP